MFYVGCRMGDECIMDGRRRLRLVKGTLSIHHFRIIEYLRYTLMGYYSFYILPEHKRNLKLL